MKNWTKPYYGVQHLNGLKRGWQVTVTDHGKHGAGVYIKPPATFVSLRNEWHGSLTAALVAGERMAIEYNCIDGGAAT